MFDFSINNIIVYAKIMNIVRYCTDDFSIFHRVLDLIPLPDPRPAPHSPSARRRARFGRDPERGRSPGVGVRKGGWGLANFLECFV